MFVFVETEIVVYFWWSLNNFYFLFRNREWFWLFFFFTTYAYDFWYSSNLRTFVFVLPLRYWLLFSSIFFCQWNKIGNSAVCTVVTTTLLKITKYQYNNEEFIWNILYENSSSKVEDGCRTLSSFWDTFKIHPSNLRTAYQSRVRIRGNSDSEK